MLETENLRSPKIFRLWSAITAVSAALERKCWTQTRTGILYPNLFTLLVSGPGVGKTLPIEKVRELWKMTKDSEQQKLYSAPDNVNKATLVTNLAKAMRTKVNEKGEVTIFSALAVAAPEFGVFFTKHDTEFLSVVNHIYGSPPTYTEDRIGRGFIAVDKPHMTLLAGTQPDHLASFLPDEAWGMGFMSRMIMVYSGEEVKQKLFGKNEHKNLNLQTDLNKIFDLQGEFIWSYEAIDEIENWIETGQMPVPQHSKLSHYNKRRILHIVKLTMISAASRGKDLNVNPSDFQRAKEWLFDAENTMPSIFAAMVQKSDEKVMQDLHYHVYQMWAARDREARRPIPMVEILKFLERRVPVEKVEKIIEMCLKTGRFAMAGAETVTPQSMEKFTETTI